MKRILLLICWLAIAVSPVTAQGNKTKVLVDNDFCGDPDGLYQLAHQALIPSAEIVGIVGGHLSENGGFTNRSDQAAVSVEKANDVLEALGLKGTIPVVEGANNAMVSQTEAIDSPGAQLIISEARKCSPEKPLYVCCGASLTNIASALILAPDIAPNIILVWIGGQEYSFGAMPPPGYSRVEYNLNLSIPAAQTVFNQSDVRIWQVPRDVYRQCLYSRLEFESEIKPCGKIGEYLADSILGLMDRMAEFGMPASETYVLGDTPLVLLTSLQSFFEPDPSSSFWTPAQCPLIADDGSYLPNPAGRTIRVYTRIDLRLMFKDMELRLRNAAAGL